MLVEYPHYVGTPLRAELHPTNWYFRIREVREILCSFVMLCRFSYDQVRQHELSADSAGIRQGLHGSGKIQLRFTKCLENTAKRLRILEYSMYNARTNMNSGPILNILEILSQDKLYMYKKKVQLPLLEN